MPGSPPNPGNGYRDTCSGVKTAVTYRQNGPWCSDIVAPPYQNEGETPRNETDHQRIEDQAACMLCPRPYQTPSNEPRSHRSEEHMAISYAVFFLKNKTPAT